MSKKLLLTATTGGRVPAWVPLCVLAFAAALAIGVRYFGPDSKASPKPAANPGERPAVLATANTKASETATDCTATLAAIRELHDTIPEDFRGLPRQRRDAVAQQIADCRARLEAFIASCTTDRADSSCDAHVMLARMRAALAARLRAELTQAKAPAEQIKQRLQEYHRNNIALCQKALECMDGSGREEDRRAESIALRCRAMDLMADVQFQIREFDPALENYLAVNRTCPNFPDMGNLLVAIGRCYLELDRTAEGVRFCRRAVEDHVENPNLPVINEVLWNLLVMAGDIDGMVDHSLKVQKNFPARLERKGMDRIERDAYRRFLGFGGFRLGYARFARGDFAGAREAFREHVEAMDDLELRLENSGASLPPELDIYRDRSNHSLRILEDRVGKPPLLDLEFDDLWATPRQVRLADCHGKAVAIVFRTPRDYKSSRFLKTLGTHFDGKPRRRELVAIHLFKGTIDLQGQLERVQDEMVDLDLESIVAGMDPDARGKGLFRAFNATTGTATFMIFDRRGRLRWYQQDPRPMDARLAIRIWDRLADTQD